MVNRALFLCSRSQRIYWSLFICTVRDKSISMSRLIVRSDISLGDCYEIFATFLALNCMTIRRGSQQQNKNRDWRIGNCFARRNKKNQQRS